MNNGLPIADTITGGKTQELSEYDKVRRSHKPITDGTLITVGPRTLSTELTCPICLDLLTNTMTTKECLHRFCDECIKNALMRGNKECPTCRNKIVSKRSLRPDPNFDALISKIWPDRHEYERMQEASLRLFQQQSSIRALQQSIEAGMKAQAATRRMRVQGSYDYEKKKRRTAKNDASGAGSSIQPGTNADASNASTSGATNDDNCASVDAEDAEMMDVTNDNTLLNSTAATINSSQNGGRRRGAAVTVSKNASPSSASASTDTSESGSESMDSSDDFETQSNLTDERSATSALSSTSPTSAPATARQHVKTADVYKRVPANLRTNIKSVTPLRAKLPSTSSTLNDKMSKWLNENQKCQSPLADVEGLDESPSSAKNFDSRLEEMRQKEEEIEVELVPAKSLMKRDSTINILPLTLLSSKFLKAPPDVTMEHFQEYLYQICLLEPTNVEVETSDECAHLSTAQSESSESTSHSADTKTAISLCKTTSDSAEKGANSNTKTEPTKAAYFYILNHNNQVRKIFLHESLYSAFITSQLVEGHLRIFFDVLPPDVNSCGRLVAEIVSDDLLPSDAVATTISATITTTEDINN